MRNRVVSEKKNNVSRKVSYKSMKEHVMWNRVTSQENVYMLAVSELNKQTNTEMQTESAQSICSTDDALYV